MSNSPQIDHLRSLLGLNTRPHLRIARSRDQYLSSISTSFWHFLYLKYWKLAPKAQKTRMILGLSVTLLSVYIISPSITYHFKSQSEKDKMFSSKRQDRYTIGLINTKNDCFANSSIQAFASLPGLNLYLDQLLQQYKKFSSLPLKSSKEDPLPQLPLHEGLALIMEQLSEPIVYPKNISVWPFLRVIEKIFNSKISTNQNDAHELIQLIIETLDNETTKFKKYVKQHNLKISIPSLPFNGLLADQLTCHYCLNSSKPSFHPFSVLSLPVPQSSAASLEDIIKNSESEVISGYNCLRCKISAILKIENEKAKKGVLVTERESQIITKIKIMEPNLSINDDLEEDLEKFIKNYSYQGFRAVELQSSIVKKTLVVKSPDLLTVHLSRSQFTGSLITRNGCRVDFPEVLELDIDGKLVSAYEEKQKAARRAKQRQKDGLPTHMDPDIEADIAGEVSSNREDDLAIEGYDDDRNEPHELAKIHSKILAHHTEEVSESPQNELPNASFSELDDFQSNSDRVHSNSTDVTSLDNNDTEEDSEENSLNSRLSDELGIKKENARYKLRAIIRHQGTHNAGHYECYRHKPLLVKDTVLDKVVNLSPRINDEKQKTGTTLECKVSKDCALSSIGSNGQINGFSATPVSSNPDSLQNESDHNNQDNTEDLSFSKFRNRLGSFVSRRSSVSTNGGPRPLSVSQAGNGMPTSPGLVTSQQNRDTGNVIAELQSFEMDSKAKTSNNKRFKKISSVAKYPFWRISDTQVTEARKVDVLREKEGVYMIYYEKVRASSTS